MVDREAILHRTRLAVLNVLVLVGGMIAVSGFLLRWRTEQGAVPAPAGAAAPGGEWPRKALLGGLFALGLASYLARRAWWRRPSDLTPERWTRRLRWSHVGSAAIAAGGVPLGLAYGWWVDARLQAIAPFWVVPLALGLLAIPRRVEIQDDFPATGNGQEGPPA